MANNAAIDLIRESNGQAPLPKKPPRPPKAQRKALRQQERARAATDGRFTAKEASRQVAAGVKDHFMHAAHGFRERPLLTTAVSGGIIAGAFMVPMVGTVVGAISLSMGAWAIAKGTALVVKELMHHNPDEAERAMGNVGRGLANLGTSAAMTGVAHAASVLNSLQPLGMVDDVSHLTKNVGDALHHRRKQDDHGSAEDTGADGNAPDET